MNKKMIKPITAKSCRYNVNGFVEELPRLPEIRFSHVCGALPTGVRPVQQSISKPLLWRLLLLPEEETDPTTFLLCWPSSLEQQPGLNSHHFHDHWSMLKLRMWEADSGWMGVGMVEVPSDQRWWLKSYAHCQSWWWLWNDECGDYLNLENWQKVDSGQWFSGVRISPSTLEPVADHWRSSTGKSKPCQPLYWTWAAALLVVRWKFQHG